MRAFYSFLEICVCAFMLISCWTSLCTSVEVCKMHLLCSLSALLCLALSVAVVRPQSHGDLRLKQKNVTDPGFTEGRVEIFLNGQWGTICEDRFDSVDANVVCHQLGLAGSIAEPTAGFHSPHGKGSESDGPIWLDEIGCTDSNGLHILSCVSSGIGVHNCDHFSDVAITCSPDPLPLSLRLGGGDYPSRGRLEVSCDGTWLPVCGGGIANDEVDTICKELGYTEATRYEQVNETTSNSILLGNLLDCLNEGTLKSCVCPSTESPAAGPCNEQLLVQCSHTIPYGTVRLMQSNASLIPAAEGVIEIFVNGKWRALCADSFTEADASAVCKKLGFVRSEVFGASIVLGFGRGEGELLNKLPDCGLNSDHLFACLARESLEACSTADPVAVVCTNNPATFQPTSVTEPYDGLMLPFSLKTLIGICLGGAALLCFCCLFLIVCCTHLFCDFHVAMRNRDRPIHDTPKSTFTFTDVDDDAYRLKKETPPQLVPCTTPQIPTGSTATLDQSVSCKSPYPFPQDIERIKLRFSQENLLNDSSLSLDSTLPRHLKRIAEQLEPPSIKEEAPTVVDSCEPSNLGSISEEDSCQSCRQ